MILRLFSTFLFLAAGLCVFLLLVSRVFSQLRNRKFRDYLTAIVLFCLTAGSVLLGYAAGFSLWLLFPVIFFVVLLTGEARQAVIRRRHRGSEPVERKNVSFSLKRPLTTTELIVARYNIHCPDWKGRLFRIAHISDIHISDSLPNQYYKSVMDQVGAMEPNLIFITGDFVTGVEFACVLPDILAEVSNRVMTFAILGNHDYWAGASEVARAIQASGIELLRNGYRRVHMGEDADLLICGCEDPWGKDRWAAPQANEHERLMVLTHTADNIYRLSRAGAFAVFAGHYHGGQIRIPRLGPVIVPSVYGRRFDHGHFVVQGAHLFVTAGLGASTLPFRVYCQPDIFIIDFHGDSPGGSPQAMM